MSPNILLNVRKRLEKASIINEPRIEKLLNDMKLWKKGQTIYPSKIKSLLLISYPEVYSILEIIKEIGILKYNYEIYCSECEKFVEAPIMRSLNEFPEELYCDDGKHKLSPLRDTILIFQVVKVE